MSKITPIFWITGNYFDSKNVYNNILNKLGNPRVTVLFSGNGEDDADAGDIIRFIKNKNSFEDEDSSRVLKIKGLPKEYNLLVDYIKFVNDKNVVIIDGPIGYYNERGTFVSASSTKLYKAVSEKGKIFKSETEASNEEMAVKWIQNVSNSFKKFISPENAKLLVDLKGLNFDILYSEIHTLSTYQEKNTIMSEDIHSCCSPNFTKTVWNILEKIHFSHFDEGFVLCERFIENLFTKTDSEAIGEINSLLGALSQNFEFLTYCKEISPDYLNIDKISAKLSDVYKVSKDIDDNSDEKTLKFSKNFCYFKAIKDKSFEKAHSWSIKKINECFSVINYLRLMLRTSIRSEFEIKLCLNFMFLILFGRLEKSQFERIIGVR